MVVCAALLQVCEIRHTKNLAISGAYHTYHPPHDHDAKLAQGNIYYIYLERRVMSSMETGGISVYVYMYICTYLLIHMWLQAMSVSNNSKETETFCWAPEAHWTTECPAKAELDCWSIALGRLHSWGRRGPSNSHGFCKKGIISSKMFWLSRFNARLGRYYHFAKNTLLIFNPFFFATAFGMVFWAFFFTLSPLKVELILSSKSRDCLWDFTTHQ